jgi:hypothetical protein
VLNGLLCLSVTPSDPKSPNSVSLQPEKLHEGQLVGPIVFVSVTLAVNVFAPTKETCRVQVGNGNPVV